MVLSPTKNTPSRSSFTSAIDKKWPNHHPRVGIRFCTDWCTWFLAFLREAYDEGNVIIDEDGPLQVFSTDHDKGLEIAIGQEFPNSYHAMHIWHLSQNVKIQHGPKAGSLTFQLASAATTEAYLSAHELQTKIGRAHV